MNQADVERQIAAAARGAALGGSEGAAVVRRAAGAVMRSLGGRPVGDPNALRAVAQSFRHHATTLHVTTRSLVSQVQHTDWQGPGADRARERVSSSVGMANAQEQQLLQLAARLDAGANDLAARQHAWDRRLSRLIREAAHSLQRAQPR